MAKKKAKKEKKGLEVPKDITYPAIVIGGCARSGTSFMAHLLTQGGIPCNHEIYFGAPGFGKMRDNAVAESSWLSVPYFPREKKRGAITIQIIRHPLKHISSMHHVHTFEDHNFKGNLYTIYKKLYLPTIDRLRLLDRYIYNWIKWNQSAEKHADLMYRLEDIVENPKGIFEDLGVDVKGVKFDTRARNRYRNVKQLKWEDLSDCLYYVELVKMAYRYKYIDEKEADKLFELQKHPMDVRVQRILK